MPTPSVNLCVSSQHTERLAKLTTSGAQWCVRASRSAASAARNILRGQILAETSPCVYREPRICTPMHELKDTKDRQKLGQDVGVCILSKLYEIIVAHLYPNA